MSDSQSDCDNHEQSNPLARPLSSAYLNIKNGTLPCSSRLPDHKILSAHDVNEESFDSSSTSEEPSSLGDGDWGSDGSSTSSGDCGIIKVSKRRGVSPKRQRLEGAQAAQRAKVRKFLTSASTTAIATPPHTSSLGKFARFFQSVKADIKGFTRTGPSYHDSYFVPAPEHPGPSITFDSFTLPRNVPPKPRRMLEEEDISSGVKWEMVL